MKEKTKTLLRNLFIINHRNMAVYILQILLTVVYLLFKILVLYGKESFPNYISSLMETAPYLGLTIVAFWAILTLSLIIILITKSVNLLSSVMLFIAILVPQPLVWLVSLSVFPIIIGLIIDLIEVGVFKKKNGKG